MNCLVTGAAGFIGGALTKKLVGEGHHVKAVIHNKKPNFFHKNVEYVQANITDLSSLKKINDRYDAVFHCAAYVKDFGYKKNFIKINLEGTKNIVKICPDIKCFIYLSHILYESDNQYGNYTLSKYLAEQYLQKKYKKDKFPVVIIRPGNVYGPCATTWVLRPLHAINRNKILLIDKGKGIFHHTYIDNLIDAIMIAVKNPNICGQTFDITDGDHSITWYRYFNDLAKIANKKPINKNISKKTALIIARLMVFIYYITGIKPIITPTAVNILTNKKEISINKAKEILNYQPKIDYNKGIIEVKKWLLEEKIV